MSAKDIYLGKSYESGFEGGQQPGGASKLILVKEYESLLRSIGPTRILNRSLLVAMVLLQFVNGPLGFLQHVPLLITTALASWFWFLQEFSTARRLGRLGELIASTDAGLVARMKAEYARPVVLPPLKKESQTKTSSHFDEASASSEAVGSSSQAESGEGWTNTYINWRYVARKDRRLQTMGRLEPIVWFFLAFAFEIYLVVLH
jgi:hypothetical protein